MHTLTPCRVLDTRRPAGPLGGPALAANATRLFNVAGTCGIPPTALAIEVNVAVTGPSAAGNLAVFPGGLSLPLVSTINYRANQSRSNNAVVGLGAGTLEIYCAQGSGTTHVILDVSGYF